MTLPLTIPVVPAQDLHRFGLDGVRKDFADSIGWPELTDQVAAAYDALPPAERAHTTILASNYGEAGALDVYGPARGLPPVICPHLTYYLWKPAHVDDETVVAVGYSPAELRRTFADVTVVSSITMPDGVRNQEVGEPIAIARDPLVPLDKVWPQLQELD